MVCFFMCELSIRAGPGLGRMSRLALQGVRGSGSSAVRTPLVLMPEKKTLHHVESFCVLFLHVYV